MTEMQCIDFILFTENSLKCTISESCTFQNQPLPEHKSVSILLMTYFQVPEKLPVKSLTAFFIDLFHRDKKYDLYVQLNSLTLTV